MTARIQAEQSLHGMVKMNGLDLLFNPRSVAFVGLTARNTDWASNMLPAALIDLKFQGKLYLISRSIAEFQSIRTYSAVKDLPECPDLVISNVSATSTPQVIRDCAASSNGLLLAGALALSIFNGDVHGTGVTFQVIELEG